MDTAQDSLTQKLTINKRNRHQYLETSIVSAHHADREITLAESRGRERRLREQRFRQTLMRVGGCSLVVLLGAAAILLLR
jgi:hypothetical protein